ncbi:MAG TPA: S1/P1 nuclease [Flavisolibacter sp.]
MKQFQTVLFTYVLAMALPLSSSAWGMTGHRIVGEIADKYITAKTRLAISKILGNETLAMSANWADFIKSDSNFNYLDPWHYVNFPKGCSYEEMKELLKKDTGVNAHTRIIFLVNELKKPGLTMDKKKMYLRLLVHIVGDIHQPLHVSPEGTRGGNDIKVNWFSQATNLHTVWDTYLIDHQQLSYTEYVKAINFTTPAQRRKWQQEPLSLWLFESYTIASALHDEITQPTPRLGYLYNYQHLHHVNEQLLKGGVRLAGLLNQIFG